MTVARDGVLKITGFTTVSPNNTSYTPVGTPRGITVSIVHGVESTDLITGVTYGGVAMARVATATDTVDEPGRVYTYFLGASIPTGTQTVAITHNGSTTNKLGFIQSVTADTDTEIGASGTLSENQISPQIALDTSAVSSLRNAILYGGLAATTGYTVVSGMEADAAGTEVDFGNFVGKFGLQTTASTGSFTIGWGSLTDDVAMVAVAIQEVQGAATGNPYPYVGGGYYPTQG